VTVGRETRAFRIVIAASQEDDAVTALWDLGTSGLETRSAGPDRAELIAFFETEGDLLPDLRHALAPLAPLAVEPAFVPEVDWVARFRAGFEAFPVGRFLVQPAWDARPPGRGQLPLVVDPGRAFGTGTHESTRLCLERLEELARQGPLPAPVLDLGSGSGILAIAARRLGASHVFAVDHDPEAVRSAREHARLNGTPLRIVQADGGRGLRARRFGLVLANIAAPFLRARAGEIAGLVAPGGMLVLSGFLGEDLDTVRAAYTALGPTESRSLGEWAALLVRRPA